MKPSAAYNALQEKYNGLVYALTDMLDVEVGSEPGQAAIDGVRTVLKAMQHHANECHTLSAQLVTARKQLSITDEQLEKESNKLEECRINLAEAYEELQARRKVTLPQAFAVKPHGIGADPNGVQWVIDRDRLVCALQAAGVEVQRDR